MAYQPESAPSIYRRRRRRRAVITLTVVTSLLFATVVYAASYVQGWVGGPAAGPVGPAACGGVAAVRPLAPRDITINVYNTTPHEGLAAAVAHRLTRQGFKVASVDNDPLGLTVRGVGQIRHGQAGTTRAILARTRLRGATLVLDGRTDTTVDIVLGARFKTLSVPPKKALPKKALSKKASLKKSSPSITVKPAAPPC